MSLRVQTRRIPLSGLAQTYGTRTRDTVPEVEFATQTLPAATVTPRGLPPTRTRRCIRPLAGSIRRTSPRLYMATQGDEPAKATPWAPPPPIFSFAAAPVAGSIRQRNSER